MKSPFTSISEKLDELIPDLGYMFNRPRPAATIELNEVYSCILISKGGVRLGSECPICHEQYNGPGGVIKHMSKSHEGDIDLVRSGQILDRIRFNGKTYLSSDAMCQDAMVIYGQLVNKGDGSKLRYYVGVYRAGEWNGFYVESGESDPVNFSSIPAALQYVETYLRDEDEPEDVEYKVESRRY